MLYIPPTHPPTQTIYYGRIMNITIFNLYMYMYLCVCSLLLCESLRLFAKYIGQYRLSVCMPVCLFVCHTSYRTFIGHRSRSHGRYIGFCKVQLYHKNWATENFQYFFVDTSLYALSNETIKTRASREMTSQKIRQNLTFNVEWRSSSKVKCQSQRSRVKVKGKKQYKI